MTQRRSKHQIVTALMIVAFTACFAATFGVANVGAADVPPGLCVPGASDDVTKPLPVTLVNAARRVLGLDMPAGQIQKTVVYRCMDGKIMLCPSGANLTCGKANVSRDLPGVAAWCRDHGQADSIPMFVTGHDTVYRWRCIDGKPLIAGTIDTVDEQGFLTRMWKDGG